MGRRIATLALCALCLPTLAGCDVIMVQKPDTSKLYVGSFPVVRRADSGIAYGYWLYVDFCPNGDIHKEKAYDMAIDLSDDSLDHSVSDSVDSLGNRAAFYDIGVDIGRYTSYRDVGELLDDGGSVWVFSSVGMYDPESPVASADCEILRSALVYSFSGISENGQELRYFTADVCRDSIDLGGLFR